MKKITRNIRTEVKKLIVEVGGVDNILNKHITRIYEKYTNENERKKFNNKAVEVYTIIQNQIDYFRYSKKEVI